MKERLIRISYKGVTHGYYEDWPAGFLEESEEIFLKNVSTMGELTTGEHFYHLVDMLLGSNLCPPIFKQGHDVIKAVSVEERL